MAWNHEKKYTFKIRANRNQEESHESEAVTFETYCNTKVYL